MLIVDDYADTRLPLSTRLKTHGHDTVFATVARQTRPDAVILDLGSPGGNGFLVWDRLKRSEEYYGIVRKETAPWHMRKF